LEFLPPADHVTKIPDSFKILSKRDKLFQLFAFVVELAGRREFGLVDSGKKERPISARPSLEDPVLVDEVDDLHLEADLARDLVDIDVLVKL
jgi:hypothetical protein